MNRAQLRAKSRRRAEREAVMAKGLTYVTRQMLFSDQAVERHQKRAERRWDKDLRVYRNKCRTCDGDGYVEGIDSYGEGWGAPCPTCKGAVTA